MSGLIDAFHYVLTPWPLTLMLLGTALGILVGSIPGLTGAMLIALTLPLTFSMQSTDAFVLLISMYVGAVSGGLVTATLLRMPGTPASVITTLDGYPMALQGQAGRALGLGIHASLAGGLVSWCFLVLLAGPMAQLSTKLGPFEFFSLVLVALVFIASLAGQSLARGIFSGLLGILAALPGVDPASGQLRLTGGFAELNDGLKLLPVLIGLFAVSQLIQDMLRVDQKIQPIAVSRQGLWWSLRDWKQQAANLLRSSLIGTWVGILPGIGANIGSALAYTTARHFSKTPQEFGHGSSEAVVASESANNATVGGALIPLIAMGIPGSVVDAILLGGLVIHGLQPGPLLLSSDPEVVHTMMATMLLSNLFMFVFLFCSVRVLGRLMHVPRWLLIPVVLVFCVVGSYALSNRMFDVWVMLGFGLLGFGLERARIPLAPFVIGFVLAPVAEENLVAGLMASGGSYLPLLTRPLSLVLCLTALGFALWPLWQRRKVPPQ